MAAKKRQTKKVRSARTGRAVSSEVELAPGQLWSLKNTPSAGSVIILEVIGVSGTDVVPGGPRVRIVTASGLEMTRTMRMREFLHSYGLDFDPHGVWRSKCDPQRIVSVDRASRGTDGPIARTTTLRGYAAAAIPISELRSSWERTDGISLQELARGVAAHDFGWALVQLREGKRVARAGWNGKGMWLVLVEGTAWRANVRTLDELGHVRFVTLPWIGMKTADGGFVPWLASQTDMLAEDWGLV